MNVLFLYEYREASANFNISLKIISELERHGVNVFHYYVYNDTLSCNSKTFEKIWPCSIHTSKAHYFLMHYSDWADKPKSFKVRHLICHPKFLSSFICYKTDRLRRYKGGRKRLEAFCTENNIDCIIGISAPHEIEFLLSDLTLSIHRFVIRLDPYAYNPTLPLSEFNKRIETDRKVISCIDKLFTTDLIIRDLVSDDKIKQYSDKMIPIEFPLISDKDPARAEGHLISKKEDEVFLLHAGFFYSDIRNPKKLVDFMKALPENYKLLVAGYNSYSIRDYDSEIRDRVIDLGCLSREEVKNAIEDSDFLISYNNLNTNMVPSKLFECIDSGKPFINLCHTDKCPTIKYVRDYDMAFTVIADQPLPKKELISFLERTRGCKSSRDQILEKFEKCTVRYVAEQILDELKDVTEDL